MSRTTTSLRLPSPTNPDETVPYVLFDERDGTTSVRQQDAGGPRILNLGRIEDFQVALRAHVVGRTPPVAVSVTVVEVPPEPEPPKKAKPTKKRA